MSAVALAIAQVAAKKVIAEDPAYARLDGLGRVMAANTLAKGMAAGLYEEAQAAIDAMTVLEGDDGSARAA